MKQFLPGYFWLPFIMKALKLDSFSRRKLGYYLDQNSSFLEIFMGSWIAFVYIVSMLLICLFGFIFISHLPEQVSSTKQIFVVFGSVSIASFEMFFYIFITLSSIVFGLTIMLVEYYDKYIIKYPSVILIGLLEKGRKYEFVIIMLFFIAMFLKGWVLQAISLLLFMYLKMETRRTMISALRMKAALLYSHLSLKEIKKLLRGA